MNWTSLIDKISPFWIAVLLMLGSTTPLFGQSTPFERLKQKFEQGQVFTADFHHQFVDSYTQDTVASKGWIWIGEKRYKVRTKNQSVVVNGKTSMVYNNNRNRVIISKYKPAEDDFAPSRILNGIDSTFTVETEEKREDQFYIRLTSDDPFAIYKKVEIFLSPEYIPLKIRAVDPVDNIITSRFKQGEFIDPRQEIFLLDYPDGAKVIDMRK